MPAEFVGEDKSSRNELGRGAWRVAWHPFDGVKGTFEILCIHRALYGYAPCCGLQLFSVERADSAFVGCDSLLQPFARLALVKGVLSTDPIGIRVPLSSFAERPKKAFGRALKIGLEEMGRNSRRNSHGDHATT